jgi:hypothetical protein
MVKFRIKNMNKNNYALLQSCHWFRSSRISQEINKSPLAAHSQPMHTCSDGSNVAGRNTGCLRAHNVFLFLLLLVVAGPTSESKTVTKAKVSRILRPGSA